MGTYCEVISDDPRAAKIAFSEIKRLEKLLNRFDPNSEVGQLNRLGKLKVSGDTLKVIKKSRLAFNKSSGAFDITVAPSVEVWRQAKQNNKLPDARAIRTARDLINSQNLLIDENNRIVSFVKPKMQIDLGGIAKGYAVDCAIKKLQEAGVKSALVNLGGNMYALGSRAGKSWKIGIRHPRQKRKLMGEIFLTDRGVSTSGDYEQYFTLQGRRYSHIINPKTGSPVDNEVVSVTVLAPDAATADFLSTAILVLGKAKGRKLAESFPNTQAVIISRDDL
ncbi:MAG: FAD:protein FMN transferase [Candidatus Omnitrophota bacterium]